MLNKLKNPFFGPIFLSLIWFTGLAGIWFWLGRFPSTNLILAISMIFVPPFIWSLKNAFDKKNAIPLKDEMSRILDIYASAYTHKLSWGIWFSIYFFRHEFADPGIMIFTGILSTAFTMGAARFYLRKNGIPLAK